MLKKLLVIPLLATTLLACSPDTTDSTSNTQQTDNQTAAPAAPPASASESEAFVLAEGRVGKLEIGMAITDLRHHLPPGYVLTDTLLHLEGQAYPSFWVHQKGKSRGGLLVEQQCEPACRIWRIRVSDPAFKTAAGVGTGSSFGEVRQQHAIHFVSLSEAGVVAGAAEKKISFVLESSALPQAQRHRLKPEDIPAATPLKEIFLF